MEIILDVHGNTKQLAAAAAWCDNSVSDIVYGGSKGSGKSFLACSLIGGDALIYPGTHYFIARKKLNDLRKFTIPSIYESMECMGISEQYFKFNGQDNVFNFYNGSKLFLLEAAYQPSDPLYMRFGSMQMTRGMIEEAGEFELEAKNNLAASVGRWKNQEYDINGKVMQTCNPSKNYLYKDYYQKNKQNELESWKRFIQAFPHDNKKLEPGYIEHLLRTLSKNEIERLINGNWEYDDDPNAMCAYDDILSIFRNDHIKLGNKKYLTADVARLGSDKAIIAVWDGWVVIDLAIFDLSLITDIQNCIQAFRVKHQIPAKNCIADQDGMGGGVVDNCGIKGFVNNGKVFKVKIDGKLVAPNYQNLQVQCAYHLADKIANNELWIQCDVSGTHEGEIIEDLEQLKSYNTDSDGKLRIVPKEIVKGNIGRSPDWRDALLMRSWFDLNPFTGNYSTADI